MRFTKTGPNIPQELIEAQKKGELLLFCGAGVSVPAGLPTFYNLTKKVAEKVNALDDQEGEIAKLLANNQFDRAFTALKNIYGDKVIDEILLKELKLIKNPLLTNHENLLKLSVNEEKKPFIITTNFDLLFEKVDKNLRSFIPPYLPDFLSKNPLSGVVYLHGKWTDPKKKEPNNLIITSQDFGRAYLSHGWATRFLSNLLTRRTVVLVGYSGDDTLVRYLLEGLNSDTAHKTSKIYAFERGELGQIERKWSQLGAIGIPYPNHNDLWESLAEWVKYTGDHSKWEHHILELSQKSPKELEAFERGQVASFIATEDGALKFSKFNPFPNSEWLYVFDKDIRIGQIKEFKSEDGDKFKIDPIDLYCIDTDPTRKELEMTKEQFRNRLGINFLSNLSDEKSTAFSERLGLANVKYENFMFVSSRINNLAAWYSNVAEQPPAIWWAQQRTNLHPLIINSIKKRMNDKPEGFSEKSLKFWAQNIRAHRQIDKEPLLTNWYDIKRNLEKSSNISSELYLDYLRDILEPRLVSHRAYLSEQLYLPTCEDEEKLTVNFEIDFYDYHGDIIDIHNDHLRSIIKIISQIFIAYIDLVKSLKGDEIQDYFHTFYYPKIDFENPLFSKKDLHQKISFLIQWMSDILKKQLIDDEAYLLEIIQQWPKNDDLIFNRLKLYVLGHSVSLNNSVVIDNILSLSDEFFWNGYIESEIMDFIENQWDKLNRRNRLEIERKILRYREKHDYETVEKFNEYRAYQVGRLLNQIAKTSVGLSEKTHDDLQEITKSESWKDSYIKEESLIAGVRSHSITIDTSIDDLDLSNIKDSSDLFDKIEFLEKKESRSFVQNKPFTGLLKYKFDYALCALINELNENRYRKKYWRKLFENMELSLSNKKLYEIGKAIQSLPEEIIFECRFSIARWIDDKFVVACADNQQLFWDVWDYIFDTLNSLGEDATRSALGETYRSGRVVKRSRKTLEHALNSPIGQLVDAIFLTNNKWNMKSAEAKKYYLPRLEKALKSEGEGAYHTVSMIMCRFNYMFYKYKKWTEGHLIPIFNVENNSSEAAWDGFFYLKYRPSNQAILVLRPYFINLFKFDVEWTKDDKFKESLSNLLVHLSYWSYPKQSFFSYEEIRKLMRCLDNSMLSQCLWVLLNIIKETNNWKTFGRHFFKNIWPKEIIYQTSKTSERLLSLAIETPDHFTDIVKYIEPYLTNIESSSLFLYQLSRDGGRSTLVSKYPNEVLLLLDKVIGSRVEFYDTSLSIILSEMEVNNPSIKNSKAWQRLYEIANHSS